MFSTVHNYLNEFNIKPHKKLGQNFLIDQNTINKIIKIADIKPSDIVVEIGPGLGALTLPLSRKAKQIIAVEKDKRMCEALAKMLKENNIKNVEIICQDGLKYNPPKNYKIVANLPYNIATAIIMKFLEDNNQPNALVVMIQKEVAEKMLEKPPKANKLAIFNQFFADLKIAGYVSKNCFYPKPKVDSAILKIIPKTSPLPKQSIKQFSQIVKTGFSHPRKQLLNNLSQGLNLPRTRAEIWLKKNSIKPSARAETLTVQNWINLTKTISPYLDIDQ